jgi:hypothetical protein
MRMDENGSTQDSVCDGIQRPCREWCDRKRNEGGRYQTLECPMIGAVRWVWSWDARCIIDYRELDALRLSIGEYRHTCALNDLCDIG